jgi:UDP-N-acetylglucosamine--N-acetylmuramyl-(pentapeptide) pyrophosphoryl-undecaprenol N-acetylglucosamine transferase
MNSETSHIGKPETVNSKLETGSAVRIIIAGGGTGGHIFPAVAIANALKKMRSDIEILFVGANGKMEMEKVPQAGYNIKGLDIAGFNRSSILKNIALPYKLIKSFLQVRAIIREFKPDAVVGVGGYSSFPVLKYAQSIGVPSFIHESNSYAGRSNKMLGRKATRVFVAADGMEKFFPAERTIITGNPVRAAIAARNNISKEEALRFFGLKEGRKTLLVVGGSLGARSINESIAAGINRLINADLQLIWQTGKSDANKWKDAAAGQPLVYVSDFVTTMENGYAAADIVVSRAGAMAISELCVVKKPVVFVPYPFAAEDHQTVNAMRLVRKNAAVMVKDGEASNKLIDEVLKLAADEGRQQILRENIAKEAVTDADERIAKIILDNIK